MKKLAALAFCAALTTCGASEPSFAGISRDALNKQIDETNFVLDDDCSGTLIDKVNGYILTANHCLESHFKDIEREEVDDKGVVTTKTVRVTVPGFAAQIQFTDANEVRRVQYIYQIVARDHGMDIGLVQVKAKLPNTLTTKVACEPPQRGDTVFAVGNPFVVLYATLSKGIVSSTDRNYEMLGINEYGTNHPMTQFTAPIAPGSSGGALLNEDGDLVGVTVRGGVQGTVGLAVTLSDIKTFLADQHVEACPTP